MSPATLAAERCRTLPGVVCSLDAWVCDGCVFQGEALKGSDALDVMCSRRQQLVSRGCVAHRVVLRCTACCACRVAAGCPTCACQQACVMKLCVQAGAAFCCCALAVCARTTVLWQSVHTLLCPGSLCTHVHLAFMLAHRLCTHVMPDPRVTTPPVRTCSPDPHVGTPPVHCPAAVGGWWLGPLVGRPARFKGGCRICSSHR